MFNPANRELVDGKRVPRSLSPLMTDSSAPLGQCPSCDREIPAAWKIIEYDHGDGNTGVFAECPDCDAVVKPR